MNLAAPQTANSGTFRWVSPVSAFKAQGLGFRVWGGIRVSGLRG